MTEQKVTTDNTMATNMYSAANPVPMAALPTTSGVVQRFLVGATNTGNSTYAPDGLPPSPIFGLGGQELQGNEIVAGGIATLVSYIGSLLNDGSLCWVLFECTGGAQQVAPAIASEQAMQFGQATGRLLRTLVYTRIDGVQNVSINGEDPTTTGATTYIPGPFMSTAIFKVQGGGGAGAGATGATSTTVSLGAPGGAGAYAEGMYTAAQIGISQVIAVGAGGLSTSGSSGNDGGTSSVGTLVVAPGGSGGGTVTAVTPPIFQGNGVGSNATTGANIYAIRGVSGTVSSAISTSDSAMIAGNGGSTPFGAGALGDAGNIVGTNAINFGTGGSGCVLNVGGGTTNGGNGQAGIVIVLELA